MKLIECNNSLFFFYVMKVYFIDFKHIEYLGIVGKRNKELHCHCNNFKNWKIGSY